MLTHDGMGRMLLARRGRIFTAQHGGRSYSIDKEALADRRIRKALKLLGEACVIERVAVRSKNLVERFQMQRVGIGQRAVNVEQQRLL